MFQIYVTFFLKLFHSNKFENEKVKMEELIKKSHNEFLESVKQAVAAEVNFCFSSFLTIPAFLIIHWSCKITFTIFLTSLETWQSKIRLFQKGEKPISCGALAWRGGGVVYWYAMNAHMKSSCKWNVLFLKTDSICKILIKYKIAFAYLVSFCILLACFVWSGTKSELCQINKNSAKDL